MTRQLIIERTLNTINQLPEEKAVEISTFAEFVMKKYEDHRFTQGIQQIATSSQTQLNQSP